MAKQSYIGTRVRRVQQPNEVRKPSVTETEDTANLTIDQGVTLFIRARETEGMRPGTIRNHRNSISYLLDYLTEVRGLQNPLIDDLSAEVIRDYINYMLTEKKRYATSEGRTDKYIGMSPNTANIRLHSLRTMCRFWYSEGYAFHNPMENIKQVRTDEENEVQGLSDAEVQIILGHFDESQFAEWRDKVLCFLLLDTGLRIQEAVGLTMERVDLKTLTLLVPSQIAKNRRNREVPISQETAKLLKELYNETSFYFGEQIEQVFNTAYGKPLTTDGFRKRLNRLKKKLGMEKLSPHQFRHTFARDYLLNGGDVFTLQKILDHSDIKTTRKYVQMDSEHLRDQHSKYSPLKKYMKRK